MQVNISQALRDAAGRLSRSGVDSAAVEARIIAGYLLGVSHMDVVRAGDPPGLLDGPQAQRFQELFDVLVDRRATREPLQHILGVAPFGPLELEVGPGVFIPRPETEVLADWAVRYLAQRFPDASRGGATGGGARRGVDKQENAPGPRSDRLLVVDLCTGSGALALYIKHAVPGAQVVAVEKSPEAIAYTRRNIRAVTGSDDAVELIRGDVTDPGLLAQLHGQVDLVVSNPPYVPETPDLDAEVYHDPHEAVFGGADGMTVITAMVPLVRHLLAPGGAVGIEHDDATSAAVQAALQEDFVDVRPLEDLTGTPRFVLGRRQ